jgi:ribose transport system ATP-binding protein
MNNIICNIIGLSKKYGNTVALDNVDIKIHQGEIVGIIGENGAGKSTLLKLISGIQKPDKGDIYFYDKKIKPNNYNEATKIGISMVFQEQALIPNLKVYENIFISHEKRYERFGVVDQAKMAEQAREILNFMGLKNINPHKVIIDYNFSTRQMIEIARAISIPRMLGIEHPLILLDEPTASLSLQEIELLFEKMKFLKEYASMIFVSHRLSEVRRICDRIYVFKDGKNIQEISPHVSEEKIHQLMVGRERDQEFYKEYLQNTNISNEPILRVENLTKKGFYENINLSLNKGEIVGIGGVLGCGKNELIRTIAGIIKPDQGSIYLDNKKTNFKSIKDAIHNGIGYVPSERHREGIILFQPVKWNLTLCFLERFFLKYLKILDLSSEKRITESYIKTLNIKTPSMNSLAYDLSGGNQQKVVIGKWLFSKLDILLLDNPTRGVDVGAKEEIYEIIRNLVMEKNISIILVTDDLLELIGLSNSIILMKDGKITKKIDAPSKQKPMEQELVKYIV